MSFTSLNLISNHVFILKLIQCFSTFLNSNKLFYTFSLEFFISYQKTKFCILKMFVKFIFFV